jgi:hypothetical protein
MELDEAGLLDRGPGSLCYVLGHRWEATERRITRRRVVCARCGDAEWQCS